MPYNLFDSPEYTKPKPYPDKIDISNIIGG